MTVDEWNNGIPLVLQITLTPMIQYLEFLVGWGSAFWFQSRFSVKNKETNKKKQQKKHAFTVKWTALYFVFSTVDFFDIFCIHCDWMAQEVLVLSIVNVSNSHAYTAQFFFFTFLLLAYLPVRLYSMLWESHQMLASSIPFNESKTVWVRMVLLCFQV